MSGEHWTEKKDIKRILKTLSDPACGAGPVVDIDAHGEPIVDDSEMHTGVIGMTGKGKSQCCSLPYMRNIFYKHESLIMLDPKGEGWRVNGCHITEDYQKIIIDFRKPRKSPNSWDPFKISKQLWRSKDPDDNDIACSLISEFWHGVYPVNQHEDAYWPESAATFAMGITYALLELAADEEINLESVARVMDDAENREYGKISISVLYDELPPDSLARRYLSTYVSAPNDTRGSIHSVACCGLEVFSRSHGLMEMLANDDIDILNIDVNRPFAIIVITPDSTDVYDKLAGILMSQITQHLIRVADERGGRLPIRVNMILEELGSVGKAISQLPSLMVAGRSRNIRLMLILQSVTQLADVYGKSKAETINSCIGLTIGFSTNNWDTLNEWSQRCGEKQVERNGHMINERLITPTQLAAMPTATALILMSNGYKFISQLSLYNEMYDNSKWTAPPAAPHVQRALKTFDLKKKIKEIRDRKAAESERRTTIPIPPPFIDPGRHDIDTDDLIARIDKKIAELEKEEMEREAEAAASLSKPDKRDYNSYKYIVCVYKIDGRLKMAKVLSTILGRNMRELSEELRNLPFNVGFDKESNAVDLMTEVIKAGGKAKLIRNDKK